MIDDLFKFKDIKDFDVEWVIYEDCIFSRDFGPWKKGDKAQQIQINYEQALIEEWEFEQTETPLKQCKFTLTALTLPETEADNKIREFHSKKGDKLEQRKDYKESSDNDGDIEMSSED